MSYSNFEKASEFTYKLYFYENIEDPGKEVPELTLIQRTSVTLRNNTHTYDINLDEIEFDRKIYQPGCITANIQISIHAEDKSKASMLSQEELRNLLLQRRIKLTVEPENDPNAAAVIADNYYVHEIVPQVIRGSKDMLFVRLHIFSMDKVMTLNQYSKAYVTKRLGADILASESKIFGFKNQLVKVNTENMQNLMYQNPSEPNKTYEFIQPYLVQYNESFYDFMVRIANRCGEFLMFEDGQLILGLPKKDNPECIKNYASISYQSMSSAPLTIKAFTRDSVKGEKKGELNLSPVENDATGYPQGTFGTEYSYNSELAHDDYIFPMFKDSFSNFGMAVGMTDAASAIRKISLDLFGKIVSNSSDPKEGAKAIAMDMGLSYAKSLLYANSNASAANKAGNKEWIDDYADRPQQCDGVSTVPFATASKDGWVKLAYYSQIRKDEEEQKKNIVHIDMGANIIPVSLGDLVTIDKLPGKYIVIQVLQQSSNSKKTSTEKNKSKKILQAQQIDVVPVIEVENKKDRMMPPVLDLPVVRKSGPQTAFIVDNGDPKKQGRVRIAFPWQAVGDPQHKQELEEAKSDLEEKKKETQKADEKLAQQQKKLETLKALKKKLAALQAELENEPDAIMQKKLFQQRRAEFKDKQAGNDKRIKEISDNATDESNPNSLASKLKTIYDDLKTGKRFAQNNFLTLLQAQEMEKEKAVQEEEKKKLIAENELLKESEKEFEAFGDSATTSPLAFLKTRVKDIEVVDIKNAKKNVDAAEKEAKTAKDNQEAANKVVTKLSQKWEDMLAEVASPWVRVAMPMATAEGGMYFKPRKGDEVMINFDCDNIERPYVVGSLYSKEHLDPDHNMVIQSPSGQKMQFGIAEDDGDFMQSLTPMLSKVGKFIPALGKKLTFGDDARKLCGNISFSDEFGMFSVDMSSTNRCVSVNSPFGNVSVSAFTGISISAPNGDVSIRGKNVSIEAGNNLRLLSGANVTDDNSQPDPIEMARRAEEKLKLREGKKAKFARWTKAGAKAIGNLAKDTAIDFGKDKLKDLTASFQIVDMQLLRCLCEVFLRPIEGTLQVKSKNFLMLEAGKGHAEVGIEQYSSEWQKFLGVEKDAEKEQFYAKTTAYINRINQKVGQFCQDYENLLKEAFATQVTYDMYIHSIYKKDSYDKAPKCVAEGFKNANKEFKKNDSECKGGIVDMSGIVFEDFKEQENGRHSLKGLDGEKITNLKEAKAYLRPAIDGYAKTAWAVHRQANAFNTLFSDDTVKAVNQATFGTASHKDTKWIDDAFKKVIFDGNDSVQEETLKVWHDAFGTLESGPKDLFFNSKEQTKGDIFMKSNIIKRKMVVMFLLELYKSEPNLLPPELGVGVKKPGKLFKLSFDEYKDELLTKKWSDVSALGSNDKPGFFKRLASAIANWTGAAAAWSPMLNSDKPKMGWERKVWNGQNGKIIFSDKPNTTYRINGENIETWKHADLGNEDNLKKAITNIK